MTETQRKRFAAALGRLADDEDLLIAMGFIVLDDAPAVIRDLETYVAASDLGEVASTAHKLKGLMSTFETDGVVVTIQDLIVSAKVGDQCECERQMAACKPELKKLMSEIRAIVEAGSA